MSLFIATGSNLGDRENNLELALFNLSKEFNFIAKSRIYESAAIEYTNQPDFYNQVLEFKSPLMSPDNVLLVLNEIENSMGRIRNFNKGPRVIDLDILFFDDIKIQSPLLTIPHPRLFERSFVILPLSELPGFGELSKTYSFNTIFNNTAKPISN